jgi:hypothetical protein
MRATFLLLSTLLVGTPLAADRLRGCRSIARLQKPYREHLAVGGDADDVTRSTRLVVHVVEDRVIVVLVIGQPDDARRRPQ